MLFGLASRGAGRLAESKPPAAALPAKTPCAPMPLAKLSVNDKRLVTATLSNASYFRRLPVQVTQCDPDLYLFLVRHPEVVVNIWEVMNISNVALERTGPDTFRASDNAGTLCEVKFCYSDHETQVIYAEGPYSGPLFKRPIRASACCC